MEDLEGKTNWEIRAEKRIEEVLNQPDPISGNVFCKGNVPYCVYYGVGTVEAGCPKTCTYARGMAEEEAYKAMEEEAKKGRRLKDYLKGIKSRFAGQ